MLKTRLLWLMALGALGCGRYFPGPLEPLATQDPAMVVADDGAVTYSLRRLEVTLQPLTDAALNRQFSEASKGGAEATNPYTFGDWSDLGDGFSPSRFTVFRLSVSNYEFPKTTFDPTNAQMVTANSRTYDALTYPDLYEYYRAYWVGRSGDGRQAFRDRTDILRLTLFKGDMMFSGQEQVGFLVFPRLHDDVDELTVHLKDLAIRFDHADLPAETIDLSFRFHRDVVRGFQPPGQS